MNVERERENDQIPNCPTNHNHNQQPAPPAGLCLCARYIYTQRTAPEIQEGRRPAAACACGKKSQKEQQAAWQAAHSKSHPPPCSKDKTAGRSGRRPARKTKLKSCEEVPNFGYVYVQRSFSIIHTSHVFSSSRDLSRSREKDSSNEHDMTMLQYSTGSAQRLPPLPPRPPFFGLVWSSSSGCMSQGYWRSANRPRRFIMDSCRRSSVLRSATPSS